jgi:hypothetical protein
MKKIYKNLVGVGVAIALSPLNYASSNVELINEEQQKQVANLLMGHLSDNYDGEYTTVDGKLGKSYVYSNSYFKDFICGSLATQEAYNCDVTVYERANPFSLLGEHLQGQAEKIQIEREDMLYGQNIYDLSTWQIGLALAYRDSLYAEKTHC